jgi:pilus assembly protein CpaE
MQPAPLSVLLIDPDARSLNFLAALIAKRGFKVIVTTSVKEGYIAALRDQPGVIVFATPTADMPGAEFVRRLRGDRRTAGTFCIALSAGGNPAELGDLMNAGCSEYIFKTPEAIEKLLGILGRLSGQVEDTSAAAKRQGGFLVVFLSAKGGTGTSSLCTNIGNIMAINQPELDVSVMDMVLPLGSIGNITGYEENFCLAQAAAVEPSELDGDYLRRNLSPLENWHFRLLAGAPDPESASNVDATRIPGLIRASRQAFDVTLVDLGRSLSRISLPVILEADVVVIVVATDMSTVTLTKKVLGYLQDKGLESSRIFFILNRAVGLEGISKSDAERFLGTNIQATIPYMAGNFTLANNQHLPLLHRFPNDTAAMMLDQISRQIIEIARQGRK